MQTPDLRILIRADGSVPYEVNEKIMNACASERLDIIFRYLRNKP